MAIGTERLHELRHPQMQALQVIGPPFGGFHVHVVARRAANIADTGLVAVLVEDRHFPGRVAEDRAPDFLRPRHDLRRMLGRVRGIFVATAAQLIERQLGFADVFRPHQQLIGAMRDMAAAAGAAAFKVLVTAAALVVSTALDRHFLRVTGRTDLAAICALAHERLSLGERPFGIVDVTAMAAAAVDVAILIERELG